MLKIMTRWRCVVIFNDVWSYSDFIYKHIPFRQELAASFCTGNPVSASSAAGRNISLSVSWNVKQSIYASVDYVIWIMKTYFKTDTL